MDAIEKWSKSMRRRFKTNTNGHSKLANHENISVSEEVDSPDEEIEILLRLKTKGISDMNYKS